MAFSLRSETENTITLTAFSASRIKTILSEFNIVIIYVIIIIWVNIFRIAILYAVQCLRYFTYYNVNRKIIIGIYTYAFGVI